MHIDFNKENSKEGSKFKVRGHVKISNYGNRFVKDYVANWFEEAFVIKKVKNSAPWKYVLSDLKGEEFVRTFYEIELQKANQNEFRVKKVIKKAGKLHVKWKGYNNCFNTWIDKEDKV